MVNIVIMSKFVNYFFILSKLSTSIFLLLVLIITGYALYNSYNRIDSKNEEYQNKISLLNETIKANKLTLLSLDSKIKNNNESLNEIKKLLINTRKNINSKNEKDEIIGILNEIQDIKKIINELDFKHREENIYNSSSDNKYKNQIKSLKKLILFKYKNGEEINKEILLLEEMSSKNNLSIFEKIEVLKINKFKGHKNLLYEFDVSVKNLLKEKFLENNENIFLDFLSDYFSIKPANLNYYDNNELNIISMSKDFLKSEEIQKALDSVLQIREGEKYFAKWIMQANIFLDFKSKIERIK